MTVLSAVVSVVIRKVKAFVAQVRALIAVAKNREQQVVADAESNIRIIKIRLGEDITAVREDLLASINKL